MTALAEKVLNGTLLRKKDVARLWAFSVYYDAEAPTAFVSMDGRRMAVWELPEGYSPDGLPKESGFVDIVNQRAYPSRKPSSTDAQFPNWRRVYPSKEEMIKLDNPLRLSKRKEDAICEVLSFCVKNQVRFNPSFFLPMAGEYWTAYKNKEESYALRAWLFVSVTDPRLSVVIMPRRE